MLFKYSFNISWIFSYILSSRHPCHTHVTLIRIGGKRVGSWTIESHHISKFLDLRNTQRKQVRIGMVFLVCSEEGYTLTGLHRNVWLVAGDIASNLKLPRFSIMTETTSDAIKIESEVKGLLMITQADPVTTLRRQIPMNVLRSWWCLSNYFFEVCRLPAESRLVTYLRVILSRLKNAIQNCKPFQFGSL